MRRRAFAGGGIAVGAITAIAGLAISTTTAFAASTTSSAYGLAAEGPIPIDPTPYVESTDGSEQTSTQLELPENPLIALEAATVSAGDDTASVELVDLALGGSQLPPELQEVLDELAAGLEQLCSQEPPPPPLDLLDPGQLCEALGDPPALLTIGLVEVFCEGDSGGVVVADVALLGQEVPIPPAEPDMVIIPENPLLSITANKQTANEDGSFSVSGVEINIGDGEEIITLGNATCGVPQEEPTKPPEDVKPAPKPEPVTGGVPVTG